MKGLQNLQSFGDHREHSELTVLDITAITEADLTFEGFVERSQVRAELKIYRLEASERSDWP